MNALRAMVAALWMLAATGPCWAGQACEEVPTTPAQMQDALRLAGQVQARLDASGAHVAILGRAGKDLTKYGLHYSHAGLVVRESDTAPWTLLHKLNRCGTESAELFRQGLGRFFLDRPYEYRALIVIPDARLESALLEQLRRGGDGGVDDPRYSLIAYPFGTRYQNSNGWLLEYLAVAESGGRVQGRKAAQAYLKADGYDADRIEVGPVERLGGALFQANVAFLDHPLSERLAGRYSVVTVESLVRYLRRREEVRSTDEVTLAGASSIDLAAIDPGPR